MTRDLEPSGAAGALKALDSDWEERYLTDTGPIQPRPLSRSEGANEGEWVDFYRSRGLVLLPLRPRTKEALLKGWSKKGRDELLEEIYKLSQNRTDFNLGIRLDGLTVLDIERPELWSVFFNAPPETIARKTWICGTGGGGYHVYMRGETRPVKADGFAELRSGPGQYVVVPPSTHPETGLEYQWLSDVRSVEISEVSAEGGARLEEKVRVLAKWGALAEALTEVWRPEHRHNLALWIAGVFRKMGRPQIEVEVVVRTAAALAHDPEVADRVRAVEDTYRKRPEDVAGWSHLRAELESIVGAEKASVIMGLLPSAPATGRADGEGKAGKGAHPVLSLVLSNHVVVEAIGMKNGLGEFEPRLLVYDNNGFSIHEFYRIGDNIIRARDPRTYPYAPYVVDDLNVRSRIELIDLIHREVCRFIDAAEDERALFTAAIVLSYVQEQFGKLPYLFIVGDNESGKTHLLTLFSELMYRPLFGVALTAADIYSYLEDDEVPMTILEDEFQGSDRDTDKMKIYKTGYKKGAKVPRVLVHEKGRRIDFFNSFGLKVVAAEVLPENRGFLRRCIIVEMVEGVPEKDYYDAEDQKRFARIRAELLKWRMKVLSGHEALPELEAEWLRGRSRELYLPLLTVLHGHELYSVLERRLKDEVEKRRLEKATSLEAVVCRVVIKQLKQNGGEVVFADLWSELREALNGEEIRPASVSIARSMETENYGRITKTQISKILTGTLGMQTRRTTKNGKTVVIYKPDPTKLRKAARKYEVEDEDLRFFDALPELSPPLHIEAHKNPGVKV